MPAGKALAIMKSYLVIEDGSMEKKIFPLEKHVTIGRSPENDISLPDRQVSKKHALVHFKEGQSVLEDLGSLNGTFLNGNSVKQAVLRKGDKLRIGSTFLRFLQKDVLPVSTTQPSTPAYQGRKRIGDILVDAGLITEGTLWEALQCQKAEKKKLGQILIEMGVTTDKDIAKALARQLNIPLIQLKGQKIPLGILELVSFQIVEHSSLLPVKITGDKLLVAMVNPLETDALQDVRFATGMQIEIGVIPQGDFADAISRHYYQNDTWWG
jgi:pSer/pThr/pTyr-binding forkhead associated (FHA) protein